MKIHPRWWMLTLLVLAAVINYLDRQSLSVAAPVVRQQFGMSNSDYALVVNSFLLAYTVFHLISGRMLDRLGTKTGYALAMAFWSLAAMGQALAQGLWSFSAIRFLLGAGEAAFLPATVKAASEWFDEKQRAFCVGMTNAGLGAGAIIAAPAMAWLILKFDWRYAFVITGATGFVWLAFWLLFPSHPPAPAAHLQRDAAHDSWVTLLRQRPVMGLMLARVLSDSAWYFYLFWLPNYLSQARGFSLQQIGEFAWIPYLSANIGGVAGGALPGWLMRMGLPVNAARKASLGLAAGLMPLAMFAAFVRDAYVALAFVSLATFLIQIWATNLFTVPADIFPPRVVASVFGIAGTAGGASAMIFTLVIGKVVDAVSYTPVFVAVTLMHPAALAVLHLMIPRIEPAKSA
jgi:ACS family hexuronate transporter-like MFS transporter